MPMTMPQRGDADDDAGDHDRDIDRGVEQHPQAALELLQAERGHGAEDARQQRRDEGHREACRQGVHRERVRQHLAVPLDRKAVEVAGVAAGVEAEQHDDADRQVQEQVNHDGVDAHTHG
jgi:cell envelope opacity-associated protein A